MNHRITIMIDEDVIKKLRIIQAKQIKESAESVSFSKVINDCLAKSLK
ncbi:MAG TPA: hypothetical protein VFN17_03015 [Nitrosarchaeum sp.]|jgi:predicted CopG family antitoxin|nr:hypothetical protein [Nitrosarchaeum sp.]